MKTNFQDIVNLLPSAKIREEIDCTVVTGPGGCNFVTTPEKPWLGGNLIGETPHPSLPNKLWPWLLKTFNPETFADVGCAEGNAVKWFETAGVRSFGIDGLERNVAICRKNNLICYEHDFTIGEFITPFDIDLVWCADVVEHIEEKYLDNIFKTLQIGKILVLSHGLEGDGPAGWHHVTNKSNQWWIDKTESYGFKHDPEFSKEARNMCGSGWFFLSGKIFRRV